MKKELMNELQMQPSSQRLSDDWRDIDNLALCGLLHQQPIFRRTNPRSSCWWYGIPTKDLADVYPITTRELFPKRGSGFPKRAHM